MVTETYHDATHASIAAQPTGTRSVTWIHHLRQLGVSASEARRGWRYTGGKRDLRIDFLRGFAVLAMVSDHLGGDPSWLYNVTGGNRFLFSAAEGFVFISGLVMGIVYCGVIAKQGVGAAMWKAFRRSGSLYMLTVILGFLFVAVSYMTQMPWVAGAHVDDPWSRAIERLTLHRAFYLTDVLLLYTLLIGLAPIAFLLMARKRTPFLLGGSWLLWALYQQWPDQVDIPWKIEDNSVFHLAAWQVLFFTGLAIGYHRETIATWARRIPTLPYFGVLTALCAALIWFQQHHETLLARFAPDGDASVLMDRYFDKADMRIGRLLAFAVFFQFFLLLVTVAWQPLVRALGWFLLPLGQSALLAYSAHLGVIVLWTKYAHSVPGFQNTSPLTNSVIQLSGVLLVWSVVKLAPLSKQAVAAGRVALGAAFAPQGRTHIFAASAPHRTPRKQQGR